MPRSGYRRAFTTPEPAFHFPRNGCSTSRNRCSISSEIAVPLRPKYAPENTAQRVLEIVGSFKVRKTPPRRTDIPHVPDAKLREQLWQRQGRRCANPYCDSTPRAVDLHLDHRIPRVRGGDDGPDNKIGLCGNCNTRKGRKAWGEFLFTEAGEARVRRRACGRDSRGVIGLTSLCPR